jgi:hypothetical protein
MRQEADRLYALLPAIHRIRDKETGEPLRALLQVIGEQSAIVEEDIRRLYDNWFIETCDDWVVPYIGDLVGYQPVREAGESGDVVTEPGQARNRILIPRRDVANTIHNRRRKGTLALLELLARDVAGWPARAVEFYTLLGRTQHMRHVRTDRGRLADLRDNDALAEIGGAFASIARTLDVRRAGSRRRRGRHGIPGILLFLWRLRSYSVTRTPAACVEENGPHCYSFSVLGHDTQLFQRPEPQADPTAIAAEANLPVPIRRWAFDAHKDRFYGEGRSLAIRVPGWGHQADGALVPVEAIMPADLSDWSYQPPSGHLAVDPVLGRITFPRGQLPRQGVRVSYHYGFSADIGGGEYRRPLSQPEQVVLVSVDPQGDSRTIAEAWAEIRKKWQRDEEDWSAACADAEAEGKPPPPRPPRNGVIELVESAVFVEQLQFDLGPFESLQLRAAVGARPVLRLLDWQTDMPDALRVVLGAGSRMIFDGLMITGRAVAVRGRDEAPEDPCRALVEIRHCTLVPGWGVDTGCKPRRPSEPSLEIYTVHARLKISRSIIGSIQIAQHQGTSDPMPIAISDSILDSTSEKGEALGAPGRPVAHALLDIRRSTVFGRIEVHAIELAENTIFTDCLCVARRQVGCMRFCYVPSECRTPRRFACQPDLAERAIAVDIRARADAADPADLEAAIDSARRAERARVHPRFNSRRYGRPDYAQLALRCAEEIRRGADDESEIGAFHHLFNPQREANVLARLEEYAPAGMESGLVLVT